MNKSSFSIYWINTQSSTQFKIYQFLLDKLSFLSTHLSTVRELLKSFLMHISIYKFITLTNRRQQIYQGRREGQCVSLMVANCHVVKKYIIIILYSWIYYYLFIFRGLFMTVLLLALIKDLNFPLYSLIGGILIFPCLLIGWWSELWESFVLYFNFSFIPTRRNFNFWTTSTWGTTFS